MRMDTRILFVQSGDRVYNPDTGNYEEVEGTNEEMYANVTDTSTERMNILYGGVTKGAKTIRVNATVTWPFDHIEIDGEKFQSDARRIYRHKTVFEVRGI